jgi:hypothetical protein
MEDALRNDKYFQQIGEEDRIDDKTAFIIKHSWKLNSAAGRRLSALAAEAGTLE